MRNYNELNQLCQLGEIAVTNYLMDAGLLRRRIECPDGHRWTLKQRSTAHIEYFCPFPCNNKSSVRELDTIFHKTRLPFSTILKVIYNFSQRTAPGEATHEASSALPLEESNNLVRKRNILSENTTTQYYLFLRECLPKHHLDLMKDQRW